MTRPNSSTAARPRAGTKEPKPRILCVDDEPHVLSALTDTLRRRFDVTPAGSGREALEVIAKSPPFAVIVSDFSMPEMDGAQFLSMAQLATPSSMRILLTGHASLEGAIEAVNAGNIFRFLTKPCAPASLVRALDDAIEQARLVASDRKLVELRLEALSDRLIVAERHSTAGRLAGAIGQEITRILHSFGTLMEGIKAHADAPLEPEEVEHLDRVRDLFRGHAAELMTLGRAGTDDEAPSDLARAVRGVVKLVRSAGLLRAVDLRVDVESEALATSLRRSEAEQLVLNLLMNAAEAVADKTGAIVGLEAERAGSEVIVRVRDDGVGIPSAQLPLLFEPYFTTKPNRTGLGLFAVKRLAEEHGGVVSVRSELGAGSTFEVRLPAVEG